MLRAALVILGKDLRLRLRDRSVVLFAVIVPLGLTVLFSFIFPDTDELDVTAAVVDLDGGEVSAGFVENVVPALVDAGVVELESVEGEQQARAAVADGELDAAWIFPEGFSAAVSSGQATDVEILVSDGQTLPGEVARGVMDAFLAQVEEVGLAVATASAATGAPPDPALIQAMSTAAAQSVGPVVLRDLELDTGDPLDATSYLAAGMAAFFVFFTVQYGITGLLEERQQGTMPRLQAAPIPPAAIQLGKVLGAFFLGVVSMCVLVVASTLILGARWGPPAGVAILIVAIVLAAMGLMALVGSFARTAEQAGNLQSIVAVVLGLLGGVFFPLPGDSTILRIVSSASPHGWFMRGVSDLTASGDWTVVLPAAAAMLAFGAVAAIPAVWIQRRSQAW